MNGSTRISAIAYELAEPVPVAEIDELRREGLVERLLAEGIATCRVSDEPAHVLGARAAARTKELAGGEPFDAIVYCTNTTESGNGALTAAVQRLLGEAGHDGTYALAVGGHACGNLGHALLVARGLLETTEASRVLLVTADKLLDPSRYAREGLTVFSDGAAACVVSAEPAESSFAVLGVATQSSPEIGDYRAAEDFTLLEASGRGVAAVAAKLRAGAAAAEDVDHVVTSNFGASLRRFLALSAGYPNRVPFAPRAGEIGHCFSADLLINLREFELQDGEHDGDRLLLLCSGPRSWTGILVQAGADAR